MSTLSLLISERLAGPTADKYLMAGATLGLAAVVVVVLRRRPKAVFVIWLCSVAFVPVWLAVHVKADVPPASAVGLLALAALLPSVMGRLVWADYWVGFLLLSCVVPGVLGAGTLSTVFTVVTQWTVAYLLGRLIVGRLGTAWLYNCIALVFSVVALGALVEFFFQWNPFVLITRSNAAFDVWGTLQSRGGVVRAEWAFGHSIALGASLALVVPIAIACTLRVGVRVLLTVLLISGAVVTFSRIAIGCAILGAVLTLVFLPRDVPARLRAGLLALLAGLGAVLMTVVAQVFVAAGQEASGSAGYRLDLGALMPDISVLGLSSSAHRDASGALYFGNFQSIDNGLLLLGLTYGALALAAAIVTYLGAVGALFRHRATPATVAVLAQLPALLSVALITQYGMFLWFFIGLAVGSQSLRAAEHVEAFPRAASRRAASDLRWLGAPRPAAMGTAPTVGALQPAGVHVALSGQVAEDRSHQKGRRNVS